MKQLIQTNLHLHLRRPIYLPIQFNISFKAWKTNLSSLLLEDLLVLHWYDWAELSTMIKLNNLFCMNKILVGL